jgi:hypothetical protein
MTINDTLTNDRCIQLVVIIPYYAHCYILYSIKKAKPAIKKLFLMVMQFTANKRSSKLSSSTRNGQHPHSNIIQHNARSHCKVTPEFGQSNSMNSHSQNGMFLRQYSARLLNQHFEYCYKINANKKS